MVSRAVVRVLRGRFQKKKKKKKKNPTQGKEKKNRHARGTRRRPFRRSLGFFVGDEVGGRAVPDGRTKRVETETAAMRVVVDVSSNRYGSLASCCFPLAAVIPPRVAAGRAFFPDTLRWEFPPSRRLGSASLFTELRLMKTVCLVRRSSPIAACGRVASESISLAVISGTRSRRARVRSYEEHIPPGHHEAHFSGTDFFARRHLASFPAFRGERFLGLNGHHFEGVTTPPADPGARDGRR